jgi:hypothetical protein
MFAKICTMFTFIFTQMSKPIVVSDVAFWQEGQGLVVDVRDFTHQVTEFDKQNEDSFQNPTSGIPLLYQGRWNTINNNNNDNNNSSNNKT